MWPAGHVLDHPGLVVRAVFLKLFEVGAHLKFFKKLWAHYKQNLTKCVAKCEKNELKQGDILYIFLYSLSILC